MKPFAVAVAMLLVTPPLLAQTPAGPMTPERATWDSARFAWEAGRYPDALAALERLLAGAAADSLVREVALLTGEYYTTRELAPDGQRVRWSADGRWASFESGAGAERRISFVPIGAAGGRETAVAGFGAAFAPAGTEVAYFRVTETRDLTRLRAQVDSAMVTRNFEAVQRARRELALVEARLATIRVRDLGSGRERSVSAPRDLAKTAIAWAPDGRSLLVTGTREGRRDPLLYSLADGAAVPFDTTAGPKQNLQPVPGTSRIVYVSGPRVVVHDFASGESRAFTGTQPAVSADGSTMAWIVREGSRATLMVREETPQRSISSFSEGSLVPGENSWLVICSRRASATCM